MGVGIQGWEEGVLQEAVVKGAAAGGKKVEEQGPEGAPDSAMQVQLQVPLPGQVQLQV